MILEVFKVEFQSRKNKRKKRKKMSAIEALRKSCKPKPFNRLPFKSFGDITPGIYNINDFKLTDSIFGGKQVVVCTEYFQCSLPARCSKAIGNDVQIAELNRGSYAMHYTGRDPLRGNMILVEIIDRPQIQEEEIDNEDSQASTSSASTASLKSKKRKIK